MSRIPPAAASASASASGLLKPVLLMTTCVAAVISSLGVPLIPLVAVDLDVSLSSGQWSLTAALLAGAVSAPILGRLGDGPHRRGAVVGGLCVVLFGCVLRPSRPRFRRL